MQTRCPKCFTQFRVTDEQIESADGYVRCGRCEKIFNVYEVTEPAQTGDATLKNYDTDSPESTDIYDVSDNEAFDFFDETNDDLMEHVVPDKFREPYSPYSPVSTLLWSTSIIALTACLFLQYAWFNRDELINLPKVQATAAKVCQTFDCSKIFIHAPSKIELTSRNVYSHPQEKDVLLVNVTMKNRAIFSQHYPVMSINFSDTRGNTVAARHFFPDEYLAQEVNAPDSTQRLLPDSSTSITMKIRDPGKQAMTYEFDFL